VLAVAARKARSEGLAPPIPLTARFPGAPAAEESAWQELVVRHLALDDWERVESDDENGELDLVGPVAARSLLRHGVLAGSNAHFHGWLLERCRGGSLLTGLDGDGLFGWRWAHVASLLARRVAPELRDALRVGHAAAPARIRGAIDRHRDPDFYAPAWLQPEARRDYAQARSRDIAEPVRWNAHIEGFARKRYLVEWTASFDALAEDAGAKIRHPFLDRRFLASLKRSGGAWGWGDRATTLAALFGDLLPGSVLERSTKALGTQIYWREPSREFRRNWDGRGFNPALIDADALRAVWLAERADVRTGLLLQSAWLHARGHAAPDGAAQRVAKAPEVTTATGT
jgi:asparagine synthase (glutamine-hydrolysing)